MRLVRFSPLQIDSSKVRIEWAIDPPSVIYQKTSFELDYSGVLDPRDLPLGLWWIVVPLILHSHWNLLRPCRIELPVRLTPGDLEFWLRMLDQERVSLEKFRGSEDFARTIEIHCHGPMLATPTLPPPVDRWATAFSGGKDSLAQTGLLCELTNRPLLVNTCAPMPPLIDNEWPYRERTLQEIAKRRDLEVAIAASDLRKLWHHFEAPHELGYPVSLGQIGDPFLVLANTIVVAASRGIRNITLATELENAGIGEYKGKVAFSDFNFASALPLLIAIDRLLQRIGMSVSSLILPFNHLQVEHLIRRRYSDLADLQISCFWMKQPTERSCSGCAKCLRTALTLMAIGDDPATLGIDLTKLFAPGRAFDFTAAQMGGRTLAYLSATMNLAKAKAWFPREGLLETLGLREQRAFTGFKRLVERLAERDLRGIEATHDAYFQYLPDDLRDGIRAISLEHWPEVDVSEYVPDEGRIHSLADWITETLTGPMQVVS